MFRINFVTAFTANHTVIHRSYASIRMTKHWQPPSTTKEQVEALRKRDGGKCWLCDKPMHFKAERNSEFAPSREHLIAESRDGPDMLDNLVLCHTICIRELKDLPLVEKIRMREQRREVAWKSAMRKKLAKSLES